MIYAGAPSPRAAAPQIPTLAEMEAVLIDLVADIRILRYVLTACLTVGVCIQYLS